MTDPHRTPPPWLGDEARFHHVGLACRSIDKELASLGGLGYSAAGERFSDPRQGITGLFVEGIGPRLELLEPLEGSTVLDPWLGGGGRMYHLAYEVKDMDGSIAAAAQARARLVSDPVPAVVYEGRRIAFLLLGARLLIELIEAPAG
jgi:methylmalonyl-CoA/ethylmalonyl-CoA epimerase